VPTLPLPEDLRRLLEKPNPAVVATLRRDGTPVTVATWYALDGDRVLLNMDHSRVRVKHLRRDPRVSLTVLDEADWHTHVSVLGRVVEWVEDEDLADIDRLAVRYTGRPYRVRDKPRVTAWVGIERWHGWGAGKRLTGND
jgi:PPOX class probable F420-dependent enzyme